MVCARSVEASWHCRKKLGDREGRSLIGSRTTMALRWMSWEAGMYPWAAWIRSWLGKVS